ncbi:protein of unknown function [Desulfovibrio sp. 86]|nr:protein of unknown function [Desulfovibrio sp. 86]
MRHTAGCNVRRRTNVKRPARQTVQTASGTIAEQFQQKRHSFDVARRAPCSLLINPYPQESTGRYGNDAALIRQRQETPVLNRGFFMLAAYMA